MAADRDVARRGLDLHRMGVVLLHVAHGRTDCSQLGFGASSTVEANGASVYALLRGGGLGVVPSGVPDCGLEVPGDDVSVGRDRVERRVHGAFPPAGGDGSYRGSCLLHACCCPLRKEIRLQHDIAGAGALHVLGFGVCTVDTGLSEEHLQPVHLFQFLEEAIVRKMSLRQGSVYLLVAVLFAFMLSVTSVIFTKGVERASTHVDWAKLYPFKNRDVQVTQSAIENAWLKILSKIEYIRTKMLEYSKAVFYYETFVEWAVRAENFLNCLNTDDIILNENYFLGQSSNYVNYVNIAKHVESLVNFNYFLQKKNIHLFYVQIPGKVCKNDVLAPKYHIANENADRLLSGLKRSGVAYVDLREEIHRQGLSHHDLFFKTDLHWKPETGLWAAKIIAERLNDFFDFDIETSLYDLDRYDCQIYGDFLGSIGRARTLAVAKLEPFTFLFPKFDTDLTIKILSRAIEKRGDFRVIYDQEHLENVLQEKKPYKKDYYSVYFYGATPMISVHNNLLEHKNDKILIIRDSFGCVLAPFLALGVKDVDTIDIRVWRSNFRGSVRSLIEKNLPNVVIVAYYPGGIRQEDKGAFIFQ